MIFRLYFKKDFFKMEDFLIVHHWMKIKVGRGHKEEKQKRKKGKDRDYMSE